MHTQTCMHNNISIYTSVSRDCSNPVDSSLPVDSKITLGGNCPALFPEISSIRMHECDSNWREREREKNTGEVWEVWSENGKKQQCYCEILWGVTLSFYVFQIRALNTRISLFLPLTFPTHALSQGFFLTSLWYFGNSAFVGAAVHRIPQLQEFIWRKWNIKVKWKTV